MTRRHFIWTAAAAPIRSGAPGRLSVPIHRVMDARTECPPEQLHRFWSNIWPEEIRSGLSRSLALDRRSLTP